MWLLLLMFLHGLLSAGESVGHCIPKVEFATLEWVDWFNNRRLLEPIGYIPPAEFEMAYYRLLEESANAA
jgi:hypothetical protein